MRWILIGLMCLCLLQSSYSDGILIPIIPEVQIAIKYHIVKVEIKDQIATTRVDQVFINQSPMQIEATYVFPLPQGVSISDFVMYDDKGNPLHAELLDSEKARQIYEDIVRRRKDPAILEYISSNAFRARIFPIQPWGEKRIQLEYSEVIPYSSGMCKYLYPLNTEKFSSKPIEKVEVSLNITSNIPIKSLWSPSHDKEISINWQGDKSVKVTYMDSNVKPDRDFLLYYALSDEEISFNLLTYREPPDDGFFVLMVVPKRQVDKVVGKNVVFVLDTSGSMSSENRIGQAKDALEFCVRNLNSLDTFNIIDFSTGVRKFKPWLIDVNKDNIESAIRYVKDLKASGGTDINGALLEALKQFVDVKNPLNIVVFLTDGQPTVGVTNEDLILKNVRSANKTSTRLFVFGVGNDVNAKFLDKLADENSGVSAYVRPGEDIELVVSDFFTKISSPMLSNISVDFGSAQAFDLYPPQLPDLFAGSQIKVFGRYRTPGNTIIKLKGTSFDVTEEFSYPANFPVQDESNKFIPNIWAARKVAYLVDQIRLNGASPELIDEIRELCIRYGIVNEYVSMLILEDEPQPIDFLESQFADSVGARAIDMSISIRSSKSVESTPSTPQLEGTKVVGGKIFVIRDNVWIDLEAKDKVPTVTLEYESPYYFNTLLKYPELGKYFSLGKEVIVQYKGQIYRVQTSPVKSTEGDLDGNGIIDLSDLKIAIGEIGSKSSNADVNGDGTVNVMDLILIIKKMARSTTN